jgi:hypothetical protein
MLPFVPYCAEQQVRERSTFQGQDPRATINFPEVPPKLRTKNQYERDRNMFQGQEWQVAMSLLSSTEVMNRRDWKGMEYTKIPEVFFAPHHGPRHQQGNQGITDAAVRQQWCPRSLLQHSDP